MRIFRFVESSRVTLFGEHDEKIRQTRFLPFLNSKLDTPNPSFTWGYNSGDHATGRYT